MKEYKTKMSLEQYFKMFFNLLTKKNLTIFTLNLGLFYGLCFHYLVWYEKKLFSDCRDMDYYLYGNSRKCETYEEIIDTLRIIVRIEHGGIFRTFLYYSRNFNPIRFFYSFCK